MSGLQENFSVRSTHYQPGLNMAVKSEAGSQRTRQKSAGTSVALESGAQTWALRLRGADQHGML